MTFVNFMNSFLYAQTQSVAPTLSARVPQGSVLQLPLFSICIITNLISYSTFHIYANDTQLYYFCYIDDLSNTVGNINEDLERISDSSLLFNIKTSTALVLDKNKMSLYWSDEKNSLLRMKLSIPLSAQKKC